MLTMTHLREGVAVAVMVHVHAWVMMLILLKGQESSS